ncbi:MAG: type IV pilus secretin PilQ [Gammaproteobacteria bacterium]|nr:type IV pilus secretin PilQ [Gammaproteobacteria bacterium]
MALVFTQTLYAAASTVTDAQFSSLPGGRVQIKLDFAGAPPTPNTFAINEPARVVLDFAETANGLDKDQQEIGLDTVESLTALQAGDRTRVVIKLTRIVDYETTVRDGSVYVTLGSPAAPIATTRSIAGIADSESMSEISVTDIDFRRGPDGDGQILVSLSSPSVNVNTRQEGDKIIVDLLDIALPPELARELDVADFATPVSAIKVRPFGNNVQLEVAATGTFEHIAYQTDDLYTVSIRPLTKAEEDRMRREQFRYTGERLSLNFQDIEVRAVLQLLADFTDRNLVTSDSVQGRLTLRLKNVPWDQALDIILASKGLALREEGNVMRVGPADEIAALEKAKLQTDLEIAELSPLRTEFVRLNFAKAEELKTLLSSGDNNFLTERGSITVDGRTNTLLVNDTAEKLAELRAVLAELDIPVRQVLIESRVVNATTDFSKSLGVRFGFNQFPTSPKDGSNEFYMGGNLNATTQAINGDEINFDDRLSVNLPASGFGGFQPATYALAIAKFPFGRLLELELSALEAEGRGEVISNPRVITANQQEAVIEQGTEIPYQSASSSGATDVEFKDAKLSLTVTPQITPDDHVIMDIAVNNDRVGEQFGTGEPSVDTQAVTTNVLVDNGETVVLGGIYEQTINHGITRTPFLGELPYVGTLFRQKTDIDSRSELLIFVTPKILKDGLTTVR